MGHKKLCIAMIGLPARGKSTMAQKLRENLAKDSVKARIFNNGALRRQFLHKDTASAQFYAPDNVEGAELREHIADINIRRAREYLNRQGQAAILDATNVRQARREKIMDQLSDFPILFLEAINTDEEILDASILTKIRMYEFQHLSEEEAVRDFKERIRYYQNFYEPVTGARNYIRIDSLHNQILLEELTDSLPYYDLIRDLLVSDSVRNLFLIRHGETYFNLENRIGGDSQLTGKGLNQAEPPGQIFQQEKDTGHLHQFQGPHHPDGRADQGQAAELLDHSHQGVRRNRQRRVRGHELRGNKIHHARGLFHQEGR